MPLVAIGVDHRIAPAVVREALAFDGEGAAGFLAGAAAGLPERLLLSTCNRTEFFAVVPEGLAEPERHLAGLLAFARGADLAAAGVTPAAYLGPEAVRHLARVASGLESMVLGEAQILGQVKAAAETAEARGALGPILRRALESALRVAKRARTETAIGEGSVSVASAAVELAARVFGELRGRKALVVGAGEMGRLVAQHLRGAGVGEMLLASRTLDRAQAVAAELSAAASGLCGVPAALREADVVVCSVAAERPILTRDEIRAAMRVRRDRILLLLDIGIPRNVEEAAGGVEGAFLHDIDALKGIVDGNLAVRRRAVPAVEAMVEEAVAAYAAWERGLAVEPAIRTLRQRFEEIRREELAKNLKRIPEGAREAAERLTESLVNRLLHEPSEGLRRAGREGGSAAGLVDALRRLFGIRGEP